MKTSVFEQRASSSTLSESLSDQLLTVDQINASKIYIRMKRIVDFFGAILGLILFLPFILTASILIKIDNPKGSVIFKQERVGKNGTHFQMYKFRTMVTDAEDSLNDLLSLNEISGAMFKMKDDPRVTKIGKFMRRTSLDELPQLWNVLKGDMSLVGPRPPLIREVEEYTAYDKQRLMVTPGCTGLWQVSGRSTLDFNEMVKLDIKYISNRSIWMDLKIIVKTVVVLKGSEDAY